MDTHSCPPNYATDQIFICSTSTPPLCNANLTSYIVTLVIFIICRIGLTIRQYQIWSMREKLHSGNTHHQSGLTRRNNKRKPVVVFISIITITLLILFTILTSLNVVGCYNGTSGIILCLYFFPLKIAAALYSDRITRLGRTLIPLSKAQLTLDAKQETTLAKPDSVLYVLNVLIKSQWLVEAVALIIVAPIFPGNFIPLSVGFYSYGIMAIMVAMSWAWQLNRLIVVAKTAQHRDNDNGRVNSAIMLLRNQQFFVFLICSGFGLLWIMIGTQILTFSYIVVVICLSSEILVMFGFVLRFHSHVSSSSTNHNNHNNNNNLVNMTSDSRPTSFRSSKQIMQNNNNKFQIVGANNQVPVQVLDDDNITPNNKYKSQAHVSVGSVASSVGN
jgi:hypothetical protein